MSNLLLTYIIYLGALASPGPDLLITLRNSLGYSTRAGIMTAAGIATALVIHFSYCIAGIGLLIAQSEPLLDAIKWIGAGYLVLVGLIALRSEGASLRKDDLTAELSRPKKSDRQAFINGFITNLFNPKATLFFLALFSQIVASGVSTTLIISLSAVCLATAFSWFSLVSVIMGARAVRQAYSRASIWIDRVFGLFFITIALWLAFS